MKRALTLSLLLISFDQILKRFFQTNFYDKKLMFLDMLGFTYVTNPGLYVSQNISDLTIVILQIFVVSVWILLFYSIKYYQKILGRSILIDLSFAFITTGLLGNLLIDRLLLGYIRDYLVLPFGVANLADFCGQIAILLLSIQIFRSPQFRNLLLRVTKTEKIYIKNRSLEN